MATTLTPDLMAASDKQITDTVLRETARLRSFIRQRMADANEAEDVLQDVFQELVEASRLPEPIEQVGAWLFRVARNRIVDRFRKKKEQQLPDTEELSDDDDSGINDLLPQADAGPEAAYARGILLDALQDALDELPPKQREVFIAHELERRSFKQLAAESGESVNTLLARKRYAVLHLRQHLQEIYDEFDL
ncbi:MAG: sigma-70 family RNA polymerase sigma factor [Collimonas pratensis]|uniref:RNA polymerase sigma factor n=1 Tax=Collimonas pratensis TaxID=279113 RepID=UPI003C728730